MLCIFEKDDNWYFNYTRKEVFRYMWLFLRGFINREGFVFVLTLGLVLVYAKKNQKASGGFDF